MEETTESGENETDRKASSASESTASQLQPHIQKPSSSYEGRGISPASSRDIHLDRQTGRETDKKGGGEDRGINV